MLFRSRAIGFELAVTWLPQPGSTLLARIVEAGPRAVSTKDLARLRAIGTRRTDRGPLSTEGLPAHFRYALQQAAFVLGVDLRLVVTPPDRKVLADLTAQADLMLARSGDLEEELAQWRRGPRDTRLDGVPVEHTRGAHASYRAEFVQRDFGAGVGVPAAMDREGLDTPVVAVLATENDQARDWLQAGRALADVLL